MFADAKQWPASRRSAIHATRAKAGEKWIIRKATGQSKATNDRESGIELRPQAPRESRPRRMNKFALDASGLLVLDGYVDNQVLLQAGVGCRSAHLYRCSIPISGTRAIRKSSRSAGCSYCHVVWRGPATRKRRRGHSNSNSVWLAGKDSQGDRRNRWVACEGVPSAPRALCHRELDVERPHTPHDLERRSVRIREIVAGSQAND